VQLSAIQLLMPALLNAFKAWLDKFWSHQAGKYDFTADLTGTDQNSTQLNRTLQT